MARVLVGGWDRGRRYFAMNFLMSWGVGHDRTERMIGKPPRESTGCLIVQMIAGKLV